MPALQREAFWAKERLLGDLRQSVPMDASICSVSKMITDRHFGGISYKVAATDFNCLRTSYGLLIPTSYVIVGFLGHTSGHILKFRIRHDCHYRLSFSRINCITATIADADSNFGIR